MFDFYHQVLLSGLEGKGHDTGRRSNVGVVQSIHNTCAGQPWLQFGTECIHAVSDARKGGGIGGIPDGI